MTLPKRTTDVTERRYTVSRELAHWREERRMSLVDKLALIAMLVIFIVGLCAVWSVQ
jgi:hypothetical protein